MISICEKVRLKQLRKAKYSIFASILHDFLVKFILSFFFEQDHTMEIKNIMVSVNECFKR